MNIIAVSGSPRGNKSQTRVLAERVLEAARKRGATTDMVDLSRAHLGFCQACEACHTGPDCVLNDDGKLILPKILQADGIILASPVYLNQVTAQMKALLDRTSHFVHCLRLLGKYAVGVTTSGGGGGQDVQAFLQRYASTVGMQWVGGVDAVMPLKGSDDAAATALGDALVSAVEMKTVYPDQQQIIEEQKRHFGRIITYHRDQWPYEHSYWKDKGWL